MNYEEFMTGCQLRQFLHISPRKLRVLMDHNIIPHIDTGLKTHKYLIRVEDAEYYANHRDLQKEHDLTPLQHYPLKMPPKPTLIDAPLFREYLVLRWRKYPDALTSNDVSQMLGISRQNVSKMIRNRTLYGSFIGNICYCSKESVINYAASDIGYRRIHTTTYARLLTQFEKTKK